MKAYTDLNQSEKLAEILPVESADMYYFTIIRDYPYSQGKIKTIAKIMDGSFSSDYDTPCWSLAALLDILPCNLKLVLAINDFQGDRKEKYVIGSVEHDKYDCFADNPVDACYELILKLNELNLL